MKVATAVRKLSKLFPHIHGIKDGAEWGKPGAIHLGDAAEGGTINDLPAAKYYDEFGLCKLGYEFGVHPDLVKALDECGFHAEWFDGGTLLGYEN